MLYCAAKFYFSKILRAKIIMLVLGIESSCDETGVALYSSRHGLLGDELYSQVKLHQKYGGVVPELASRDHIRKILPLTKTLLEKAGLQLSDLDGVAYTSGPGLVGALLVGASFARSLAFAINKPALAIHHMEGHILASMLGKRKPVFPFLALLVSGGHTQLIDVQDIGNYKLLGDTVDDAVGEAFDKTAKLLGLGYPGGARLARMARDGKHKRFIFPRPMVNRPGLDFSFSGLKTFALNTWNNCPDQSEQDKADIAKAFQDAVVDTLIIKCKRALDQTNHRRLVVAGGVGANSALRSGLKKLLHERNGEVFFPPPEYCTDNGAMIAYAGCLRLSQGDESVDLAIRVQPRWPLSELN